MEDVVTSTFVPGKTLVPYAGRVYDEAELINLHKAADEFWLTEGRWCARFENKLKRYLGVEYCRLVNSGSSANLVAFSALTSHKLGDSRIDKGDEVITVAAGFPTTVAPIIQHGAIPVFVDVDLQTANIDVAYLEQALSPRTKAVMVAHTLGNPFDVDAVQTFCRRHDLWLLEDNCDAMGSKYGDQFTGTFGGLATSSFYPAHHITTGEGGAIYTNSEELDLLVASFRDWGRDCYCRSGKENTCGKRFAQQHGRLPEGYDHKYTFSHFGYNLKMTDLSAAIGVAQMDKLESFGVARRANHAYLQWNLEDLGVFDFQQPTPKSYPSWFGFLMTVRDDAPFTRDEILQYLEAHKIQTRMLFAGNMTRQPCFDEMRLGVDYRIVGELTATDRFMNDAFLIGCYPGLQREHLDYIIECITRFVGGWL